MTRRRLWIFSRRSRSKLKRRQWGEAIRLEIEDKADQRLLKILKRELEVNEEDIFEMGALDLTVLMKMYGLDGYDHLKTPKYTPQPVPALMNDDDIFTNIRKGDILLHHPYQTFDPVVDFVRSAAKIRRCWLSNRPCIVSAAIPRSSRPWRRRLTTGNRSLYWWS